MAQEIEFFTDSRRECELGDFHSLQSKGNERRIKVAARLPLSNRSMVGLPEWVSQGHELVVKDKSYYNKSICKDMRMEGMSIDFFTTDTVKRKSRTLNGCTLDKFSVERVGKDDKSQTFLNFIFYSPCSLEVVQYFYEMQGGTAFVQFDTTQASFSYDGEEESGDSEGEPEDVSANAVLIFDPNDDPKKPLPNDTRKVSLPTDKPVKRSHHKKKE